MVFGINDSDIKNYKYQYDFLKNRIKDLELLEILKKYGKLFEIKINNDPILAEYKERWNNYISSDDKEIK